MHPFSGSKVEQLDDEVTKKGASSAVVERPLEHPFTCRSAAKNRTGFSRSVGRTSFQPAWRQRGLLGKLLRLTGNMVVSIFLGCFHMVESDFFFYCSGFRPPPHPTPPPTLRAGGKVMSTNNILLRRLHRSRQSERRALQEFPPLFFGETDTFFQGDSLLVMCHGSLWQMKPLTLKAKAILSHLLGRDL